MPATNQKSSRSKTNRARNKPRNPAGRVGAPVSLYPLSFKEAVAGLAQVKMPEPESKKPKTKPAKGQHRP
jgi:hypothetical protein